MLLTQDQIHWELVWNENDLLILAGFALALYWLDKKPFIAGASLGLTATIKYQGLCFLPFLIFRARWRVVMGLIAGTAAGAFLPALMIGWDRNLQYLMIALRGIANMTRLTHSPLDYAAHVPSVTWGANISVSSSMLRIFHDPRLAAKQRLSPAHGNSYFYFLSSERNVSKTGHCVYLANTAIVEKSRAGKNNR